MNTTSILLVTMSRQLNITMKPIRITWQGIMIKATHHAYKAASHDALADHHRQEAAKANAK